MSSSHRGSLVGEMGPCCGRRNITLYSSNEFFNKKKFQNQTPCYARGRTSNTAVQNEVQNLKVRKS